jgi:hypothetical protein
MSASMRSILDNATVAIVMLIGFTTPMYSAEPLLNELVVTFDNPTVTVGDKVRINEMISEKCDVVFGGIFHEIYLIGMYDTTSGRLENLSPVLYKNIFFDTEEYFQNYPHFVSQRDGIIYRLRKPGLKGTSFEFTTKVPGVYLISVSWRLKRDFNKEVVGPPIVLTVRPKVEVKE